MAGGLVRIGWLAGCLLAAAAMLLFAPRAEAAYVYWANWIDDAGGSIGRANLDGSGVNNQFAATTLGPCGVAANTTHVYWTAGSESVGYVGRSSLQTGLVQGTLFQTPANYPCGVAVGPDSVYFVSHNPHEIGRANLDGTGVDPDFISAAGINPQLPTVYGNHLYWVNKENGSIARANLDGTNVDLGFVEEASATCNVLGVAVNSQHVYWAVDYPCYTIGRADLDGGNPDEEFIEPEEAPCGIAATETHLYWAAADGNIVRADVAGNVVEESFIKAGDAFCGVAIGPDPAPFSPPVSPAGPSVAPVVAAPKFAFKPPVTCTESCKKILVKFEFGAAGQVVVEQAKPKGKAKGKGAKKPKLVKRLSQSVKAGLVTLKLKPTKAGKEAIAAKGKLKAKLTFAYTPSAGAASTLTQTIKAKPPKPKKR